MPRHWIAILVALSGAVLVVGAVLLARAPDVATSPPSPSPATPPTATAISSPTATPTASPSPTPQALYVSKRLGYALTLSSPWRMASCPASDPTRTALPLVEQLTNVGLLDEELGHIGSPNDRIEVYAFANPRRLSPVEFARSQPLPGPVPGGSDLTPESVTFAGRPAAQLSLSGPFGHFLFVADGDRMFTIAAKLSSSSRSADLEALLRVVRTFRFATAPEVAAVADPTPMPAGAANPQALAGVLATAFQQKDVATLERLLSPCVSQGVQNGGGSAITRDRFIASLRTQFANGLTVTVDPSTVSTDRSGPGIATVRSRWSAQPPMGVGPAPSPGQAPQDVALMLAATAGGYYWSGTILLPPD